MHDDIIRYSMTGTLSATSNTVRYREEMIRFLQNRMKDDGVASSIDVDPQFTLNYDSKTETYDFVLSVYGVHVGGNKVWEVDGVMSGKTIPSTLKARLKPS